MNIILDTHILLWALTGSSKYCKQAGFKPIEIKEKHIFQLHSLKRDKTAPRHNDPFDRIILSQAKTENYKFVTHDVLISQYQEPCIISV
jgi:PIN domain nuclease of toxin-antitoxin system